VTSKKLVVVLTLLLSATSASLAQSQKDNGAARAAHALTGTVHHRSAHASRQLYLYAPDGVSQSQSSEKQISPREAAIHECSVKASKYSFSTWQTTQFAVYGTCMYDRGQQT
jgi:hypothetical protein